MGAILVNINPAYRTSELEYALNQSGISFLILAARFRQADYVAMLGEVKGRCPGLREALVIEDGWDALKWDERKSSQASCTSSRRRCRSTTRSTSSKPPAPPA